VKKHVTSIFLAIMPFSPVIFADTSEGKYSLSTGATYTSGDYGSQDTTELFYVPVSLKYKQDKWSLKLTVPYIRIKGPQNVIQDIGQVSQSVATQSVVNEGLGDISVSANYQLFYLPKAKTVIDVTGKIKFGTADETKFLGTGKTDYSLSTGLYKLMGDFTPYATLGRKFYGESAQFRLDDVYFSSLGLGYKVSSKTSLGANFYWKDKTASTRSATRELSSYLSYKLDTSWKLQAYLIRGLSDNTPDFGGGFSLAYELRAFKILCQV